MLRKQIYEILEKPNSSKFSKIVNYLIYSLVIISVVSLYISTVKSYTIYQKYFDIVEYITIFVFTLEFILRISVTSIDEKYKGLKGKIKYIFSPFILVDIVVLVSFYLPFFGIDLVFLRVLRLMRIFKLFRNTKYDEFDDTLIEILEENKSKFVVILVISVVLVIFTAPIMYYLENPAQPEVFSSMPASLWWTTVTFTTVGYGDMYPVTTLGKILATFVSVFGIAFYAIPGAIFTSALLDKLNKKD